jgi:prepilin-type N-terminal cleavage/methylation domain-containing protein
MMKANARSGFTMVELIVVVVLGSLILMAAYQILATNTRIYAVNNARVQGQQNLRGALDILSGELREISGPGGDLVVTEPEYLTIRAQRTFGLVCAVNYAANPVELTAFRVGPAFRAGDSVFVFHDNDPDRASDDEWFGGVISAVDSTTTCAGSPAQTLRIPFLRTTATAIPPDSVRVGAPLRGFEVYTYGQVEIDGELYLGRQLRGASAPDPLVGPLQPDNGVTFRYLDSLGHVTTVDTLVAQIELSLHYQSELRGLQNQPVSDSIVVRVYPRN